MCQVVCHWFSGLEAALHHCTSPAITIRFLLSLASCLQQKIIHLLVWYTKPTLFLATRIYHSKFTSRLQGWGKRGGKRNPISFLTLLCPPTRMRCHRLARAVTQKGAGCSLCCHSSFVFSWRALCWMDRWWSHWYECNFSCLRCLDSMGFCRNSHGLYFSQRLRSTLNYFPHESEPFVGSWKSLPQTFYIFRA